MRQTLTRLLKQYLLLEQMNRQALTLLHKQHLLLVVCLLHPILNLVHHSTLNRLKLKIQDGQLRILNRFLQHKYHKHLLLNHIQVMYQVHLLIIHLMKTILVQISVGMLKYLKHNLFRLNQKFQTFRKLLFIVEMYNRNNQKKTY